MFKKFQYLKNILYDKAGAEKDLLNILQYLDPITSKSLFKKFIVILTSFSQYSIVTSLRLKIKFFFLNCSYKIKSTSELK
jgi:hypothetical protein